MSVRPYVHDPGLVDGCPYWAAREQAGTQSWIGQREHRVASAIADANCYWCTRERRLLRTKHRQRPHLPHVAGACQLCGGALTGRRRSWCSDECGQLWANAANQSQLLPHLTTLHGWACWACGIDCYHSGLEVDHIKPLWSLSEEEAQQPRWWLPFNLQLLCRACHRTKTAAEARQRAAGRWVGAGGAQQMVLA